MTNLITIGATIYSGPVMAGGISIINAITTDFGGTANPRSITFDLTGFLYVDASNATPLVEIFKYYLGAAEISSATPLVVAPSTNNPLSSKWTIEPVAGAISAARGDADDFWKDGDVLRMELTAGFASLLRIRPDGIFGNINPGDQFASSMSLTPITNLYNAPVMLSAAILSTTQFSTLYGVPCDDTGTYPPGTGTMVARNCTTATDLVISAVSGSGTNTLVYDYTPPVAPGDVVTVSAAGVATECVGDSYIPTVFVLDGDTGLRQVIATTHQGNEQTISIWVMRTAGSSGSKIYDIGDGATVGVETSRLRYVTSTALASFVSSTPDNGTTWDVIADIVNPASLADDTYEHLYVTFRNDVSAGPGSQIMELWLNGVSQATETVFQGGNSTPMDFIAGDFLTLLARHDLSQFITGGVADIWTSGVYMDGATHVPLFRSATGIAGFNGSPVNLGVTGVVNGITPGIYLGGPTQTVSDWSNGINRGTGSNFTLVNAPVPLSTILDDNFTGADGTQLVGRTPDTIGSGAWVGNTNLTLNGLGEVRHLLTSNLVLDTIDVGISEHISTITIRALAGTANNNQVGIAIRGNAFSDVLYLVALTSFTSRYELKQREGGNADTVLGVLDLLGSGIKGVPLTFRVTDDATGVLCECIEDGTSFFVPSAGIIVPPDNNVGVYYRNTVNADEIFITRITTTVI